MKSYEQLLLANKAWAKEKVADDPDYFNRLLNIQTPNFLWIGCSDSRVPPDQITQTQPGDIFIHRNVANLVMEGDLNLLSCLQYSVEVLKVEHVIICGHYGCGGVRAAMGDVNLGVIDYWLLHIKKHYNEVKHHFEGLTDENERVNRMVEFNVIDQLHNLARTPIIQNAWKQRNGPQLHGWVYDLHDGIIKPVAELGPQDASV